MSPSRYGFYGKTHLPSKKENRANVTAKACTEMIETAIPANSRYEEYPSVYDCETKELLSLDAFLSGI